MVDPLDSFVDGEFKFVIKYKCYGDKDLKSFILTKNKWDLLENLVKFLKHLALVKKKSTLTS